MRHLSIQGSVSRSFSRAFLVSALLLSMSASSSLAVGFGTNTVPYWDSFEDAAYTNGYRLVGSTNGWYSEKTDAVEVLTSGYAYGGMYPLDNAAHSKVLRLSRAVTNLVESAGGTGTNWVDLMMLPNYWAETNHPVIPANSQMSFYFNTNGHMVLWHEMTDWDTLHSNVWTEITHPAVSTTSWVRISVAMNYNYGESVNLIQICLDGVPLTNELAWTLPDINPAGSWFINANSGVTKISALAFSGAFYIDDLVVTNGPVEFPAGPLQYTITTTDGGNGSISPINPQVLSGGTTNFSIVADTYYHITDIKTNGITIAGTFGMSSTNFVWANITAPGTLYAAFAPDVTSSNTPHWWFASISNTWTSGFEALGTNDHDGDGALTWLEHLASTDPLDSNSYFRILGVGSLSNSNFVRWLTVHVDSNLPPFGIERRTNVLAGNWDIVERNAYRVEGSNTWWDTSLPPGAHGFYRLIATNVVE